MAGKLPPIFFNRLQTTGAEIDYIEQAIANHHLSGNGPFGKRCEALLQERLNCARVLLTHSCTAALEMAALLAGIEPGDEVIMPSFTFVGTASAFALRGATPVFVDIREDTLNLDERLLEDALSEKTRAVVPVHYAGVGCAMEAIMAWAKRHRLMAIEDAAQTLGARYRGAPLGSLGQLAAVSFHETKNIIAGEGGALLINDKALIERAEVIHEKGTNRGRFLRGEIGKYTWVELGSSYSLNDLTAAFLLAQLQWIDELSARRKLIWSRYFEAFAELEAMGLLRRPVVPDDCQHNAHLFYLLLETEAARDAVLSALAAQNINAAFHYVPLHSSPAGKRYGRCVGELEKTTQLAARLLRLPLYHGLSDTDAERVIATLTSVLNAL